MIYLLFYLVVTILWKTHTAYYIYLLDEETEAQRILAQLPETNAVLL